MSWSTSLSSYLLTATDGGGVTAICELVILKEIMLQIQMQNYLPTAPKPCEIFDMIGGTSTGGLIAIMLGRLRMTVDETLQEYRRLAKTVFSDTKNVFGDEAYKATTFEKAVQAIVRRYGSLHGEKLADSNMTLLDPQHESACKVFVCCRSAMKMSSPRLHRSYSTGNDDEFPNATIWQTARATTAMPGLFKRVQIKGSLGYDDFIDGSLGSKNPAKNLLEEASEVFGPDRAVSCIVSIGSGKQQLIQCRSPGLFQRILPTKLVSVIMDLAIDAEETASELEYRFLKSPDLYFRFNVEDGMHGIKLGDWTKMPVVESWAIEYLRSPQVLIKAMKTASALYADIAAKSTTLKALGVYIPGCS